MCLNIYFKKSSIITEKTTKFVTKATTNSITDMTTEKPSFIKQTGKWSEWAEWYFKILKLKYNFRSTCSEKCGGCGERKRVRACYGGNRICRYELNLYL